jgi:hypothetical protein
MTIKANFSANISNTEIFQFSGALINPRFPNSMFNLVRRLFLGTKLLNVELVSWLIKTVNWRCLQHCTGGCFYHFQFRKDNFSKNRQSNKAGLSYEMYFQQANGGLVISKYP